MEGYNSFAGCTYDTIRYIAEAKLYYKNKLINLYNKEDGLPNIKACMHLLGFDTKHPINLILRSEEDRRAKETNPDLLVRSVLDPKELQWCNIYAGKLRPNYTPPEELHYWLENIAFDEDVMHVVIDAETTNIEEFGSDY